MWQWRGGSLGVRKGIAMQRMWDQGAQRKGPRPSPPVSSPPSSSNEGSQRAMLSSIFYRGQQQEQCHVWLVPLGHLCSHWESILSHFEIQKKKIKQNRGSVMQMRESSIAHLCLPRKNINQTWSLPGLGYIFAGWLFSFSFEYLEQNTPRVVNDFKDTGSTVRQVIKMYTACVG